MDTGTLTNAVALSVSVLALTMSTLLAIRQLRTTRAAGQDSNHTQVLLRLNGEYRTDEFQASEEFVLERLAEEHDPGLGIGRLPSEARRHARRVGHYYADYGMLSALPTVDSDRIVGVVHFRVREAWVALEPYVRAERRERGSNSYWRYFEHLACLAAVVDKERLLADQRLLSVEGLEADRVAVLRRAATSRRLPAASPE
jgi:hypothetical protein